MTARPRLLYLSALLVLGAAAACGGGGSNNLTGSAPGPGDGADGGVSGDSGAPGTSPFEPVGPQVYVLKVKALLTGLAATDAEVQAVVQDPNALRGLIDGWMALPQFEQRAMDFFRNAYQQNQVNMLTLTQNLGGFSADNILYNQIYRARLERSLMDSFPQTAWELVKEGQPLNQGITTNRYMLTTAMLSMMSYIDERSVDDNDQAHDQLAARGALAGFTLDPKSTATLAETLDPTSKNYMIWHDPVVIPATCTTVAPVVYDNTTAGDKGAGNYRSLFGFIFGSLDYQPCFPGPDKSQSFAAQLSDADFEDWHLVTIHPTSAASPNTSPTFWEIPSLRTATDITLRVPRIGFAGTLAFAANWGTNTSNESRVTANQSLIVGIGQSINGENSLVKFPVDATDSAHATDPACMGCHGQLDPYKQFFRQSWSLYYHEQTDVAQNAIPANFNIDGVMQSGQGIGSVMGILASHPRYALAWTQKLYFWGTSTPALEDDPELLRVADVFTKSNFDFKTLVRELFSSPLVTLASGTSTTETSGVLLSIARRDQYCASLSNRLGLPDVCGMAAPAPTTAQVALAARALLLPVDTYYRAYALPSLPTSPDLFFRSSVESMCQLIADQVVDVAGGTSRYTSTNSDAAIADFVATVMDVVPSDLRSAPTVTILNDHFANAKAAGANATDALKSTFTLACIAPSSVIVGL